MTSSHRFLTQQQCTETYVHSEIGLYDEAVAKACAVGYIVGHVAAIDHVEMHLKIFVGTQIILKKQADCKQPVCRPPYPSHILTDAVCYNLVFGIRIYYSPLALVYR